VKRAFSERVERGRVSSGSYATARGDTYGYFFLVTNTGQRLGVMISSGSEEICWEHVSVSHQKRCPTWEEMCWVKDLFFDEEEVVVQYHPRKSEYVNYHPFCLHLWKPLQAALPTPPPIAVGPRSDEASP